MDAVEEIDRGSNDVTDDGPVDIVKVQQDFYESLKNDLSDKSSHGYSEILNKEVLKDMLTTTMMCYTRINEEEMSSFTDCLWEQKKYCGNDDLRISQLFVCCVHDSKGELTYPLSIKSTKFVIRPIYRIPKCFKNTQNQRDCCAVFVDEFARVYKSWNDFREKNKFGNCLIVAPKGGYYDVSSNNDVELDISYQKDGVFKYFDYGSTAASLGSAGVILVGLIPAITIAPVVLTGAGVAGTACAIYAAGRSVYQLFDRKRHDQSIGLRNRESRAAYINITSGALCASAAAGARIATKAALNRQTISVFAQRTIRYVGVGSLSFQIAGCADELYSIISDLREKKPMSTVYFAQFGAQIFLLALSVKNYKLTQKLTEVSGSRNPKTIRKMLRQHNSEGSLKYLFSGADFIEKFFEGFTSPMMLQSIFSSCLNVAQNVKTECKNQFDRRFKSTLDKLLNDGQIKQGDYSSMDKLLKFFLGTMNLNSLEKFLKLTKKFVVEIFELHKSNTNANLPFNFYLKSIYMSMIKNKNDVTINDFVSALTNDSFNMMVDEIKADFSMVHLCFEFDKEFTEQMEMELSLGRKIYLIVEERCKMFVTDFIEFPITSSLDNLAEAIQYVLRRLTIEGATLFFGITKQILNECIGRFVYKHFSTDDFIKEHFQKLLKRCNGILSVLERNLKIWLDDENGIYDQIKKETIDQYFHSKRDRTLKECKTCGGQTFI